jgi:c-di-GMP-binding flagellar brake protein YcgR
MRHLPNRQPTPIKPQRARVEFVDDLNLIEAQNTRAIIDIEIEGRGYKYQSVILSVDPAAGSILIDELFPAGFNGCAGQAVTIAIRRQDGSRAGFATHITERSSAGGVDNYRLSLPGSVGYQQRREVFRLRLSRGAATHSEFQTTDRQFCAAVVRDLSATGIRLELQNSIQVAAGDLLTGLDFEFEQHRFHCQAAVRHVHNGRSGEIVIGAVFRDISRSEQRLLERIIMQQQRRAVRQAHADQENNLASAPPLAAVGS